MELLGEYVFQRLRYICFILIDEEQVQFLLTTADVSSAYCRPIFEARHCCSRLKDTELLLHVHIFCCYFFLNISSLLDGRMNLNRTRHSAYVGKRRTLPPCDSLDERLKTKMKMTKKIVRRAFPTLCSERNLNVYKKRKLETLEVARHFRKTPETFNFEP